MARILTHCPSGGKVVHTGQQMTDSAFARAGGRFSFRCAACGDIHHWRKEDAWSEGQRPPAAAVASA